jgi:hypothetical protein
LSERLRERLRGRGRLDVGAEFRSVAAWVGGRGADVPAGGDHAARDVGGREVGREADVPAGVVAQLVPINGDAILFRAASFVEPGAWYRYDATIGKVSRTGLFSTSPAKFDDCVVEQKFATSKDGTKVPIHILRLKTSMLEGATPTLLSGYGGYGISMKPSFIPSLLSPTITRSGRRTPKRRPGFRPIVEVLGSDELAAMDGDFIMTAHEVQPVLRALRKANIHIVALHNHMVGEEPAFYFLHYWGKGPTQELAHGVKSALDAQKKVTTQAAAH